MYYNSVFPIIARHWLRSISQIWKPPVVLELEELRKTRFMEINENNTIFLHRNREHKDRPAGIVQFLYFSYR